jgi:ATP-binding cassette subfamily F protein uup
MSIVLNSQSLSKSYSSRPLFSNINFGIDDRDKLGLIGPNGAGKSTLLKIFAGQVQPDDGNIVMRKGLHVAYVPQDEKFPADQTVHAILSAALPPDVEEIERQTRANIMAAQLDFADDEQSAGQLSGGWLKRLSLGCQLIKEPELLLLDEPTNHLDLQGVLWLEKLLAGCRFPFVLVTHDRAFLENVCNRVVELNPTYAEGFLSVNGHYSDFLLAREQYIGAQAHLEQAMASQVRREVAWLQRGARARQRKSSSRIQEAHKLLEAHAEVKYRNQQDSASVDIDFSASGRKTKELVVAKELRKSMGDRLLFKEVSFILKPGTRLGLLGENGSGKTTLIRLLTGELLPDAGSIKRADQLRIVVFDQSRAQLDQTKTLKEALCPSGDSVVFRDRSLHVATWGKKFLFRPDQLSMPISYLSGGEQARILIANLMLQPADILILDEPTNDLDIPSLEVLEESLSEFPGAIVLVSHDRFMLDSVSNSILALDGRGSVRMFVDYTQWEDFSNGEGKDTGKFSDSDTRKRQSQSKSQSTSTASVAVAKEAPLTTASAPTRNGESDEKRKSLSTNEKRELTEMDQKIAAAEATVAKIEKSMLEPSNASNSSKLQSLMTDLEKARRAVEQLYARWQDLEERSLL